MPKVKRRILFGATFWGFLLFIAAVGVGLHQAGRQLDQMLGWEGQTVLRIGQTPDGRLDLLFLGGRYGGPRLPGFLGAKGRGVDGELGKKEKIPKNGEPKPKAEWRQWATGLRLSAARLVEGVSQFFSDWQIDGPLQEKAPPR